MSFYEKDKLEIYVKMGTFVDLTLRRICVGSYENEKKRLIGKMIILNDLARKFNGVNAVNNNPNFECGVNEIICYMSFMFNNLYEINSFLDFIKKVTE